MLAQLFQSDEPGESTFREWSLLTRRGRPFLLLPANRDAAVRALELYPAQRLPARQARRLLGFLLRTPLPLPLSKVHARLSPRDPFVRFLQSESGADTIPTLAILAGNPNTPGQRNVLLLFDSGNRPVVVVKAGTGTSARGLIQREADFLSNAPTSALGIPQIKGRYDSPGLAAFALDYLDGAPPSEADDAQMALILNSWIDPTRSLPAPELPAFRALEQGCANHPAWKRLDDQVRSRQFHPTIHHGDFAPWNLRTDSRTGRWTVLDWERAESAGPPGWDWFHFLVQKWILVNRLKLEELAARTEALLERSALADHLSKAGAASLGRTLFLAYLLHSLEVVRPSEGLEATRDLFDHLARTWQNA